MKMRDVRRYETQVKEDCYQAYDGDDFAEVEPRL